MIPAALHNGLALAILVVGGILALVVVWQITKSLLKLLLWIVALGLVGFGVLLLLNHLG